MYYSHYDLSKSIRFDYERRRRQDFSQQMRDN